MSVHDWYRRTTWTEQDQQEFFARFKRSRGVFTKAQYLRIQAYYLRKEYPEKALELLDMMIKEYPEPGQLVVAYQQKAELAISLGDKNKTIDALRESLQAQRISIVRTEACYTFGLFVIANEFTDLYKEALDNLDEFGNKLSTFPDQQYRYHGIKAIILEHFGKTNESKIHAQEALNAAAQRKSGLKYHQGMGLVTNFETVFHKSLLRLADTN